MRNQHLQLEDFALARLHVDWNPVEAPSKAVEQNISITCKIAQSEARPGLFMLKLELQINSIASQPKPPYEVAAHIMGSFFVPGEAGKGEMARRVVLSGGAILLGILRGEIAAITGSRKA
ncbi:hypothetical protein HYR69_01490 [Candidatus Sumerlaeota bacterium]|nr:hypothetical protein [Candidatus Sumerlaeota bacterium]